MSQNTLRQVLTIFENASGPQSLAQISRELNVSRVRLEGMIQYWVRKGKIREASSETRCGSCGLAGSCPFVFDMPRSYELATGPTPIPSNGITVACKHRQTSVPE